MNPALLLPLIKRNADKLGLWALLATVVGSLLGIDPTTVEGWIEPLQNGDMTVEGLILVAGSVLHWWMDRQKEEEKAEAAKEAAKVTVERVEKEGVEPVKKELSLPAGVSTPDEFFADRKPDQPAPIL